VKVLMSSDRCPKCGLLFPLEIQSDVCLRSYCQSVEHWDYTNIHKGLCERNLSYLISTFIPITPEERAIDARVRRILAWLEDGSLS
jgi:hypothetical protein